MERAWKPLQRHRHLPQFRRNFGFLECFFWNVTMRQPFCLVPKIKFSLTENKFCHLAPWLQDLLFFPHWNKLKNVFLFFVISSFGFQMLGYYNLLHPFSTFRLILFADLWTVGEFDGAHVQQKTSPASKLVQVLVFVVFISSYLQKMINLPPGVIEADLGVSLRVAVAHRLPFAGHFNQPDWTRK